MLFGGTNNAHVEIGEYRKKKLDAANLGKNWKSFKKLSKTLNHKSSSKFTLFLHV